VKPLKAARRLNDFQTGCSPDLATRVFGDRLFQLGWLLFLAAVLVLVSWPIRNALLVCWVYGPDAYFRQGVRVLPGKPIRFTNGILAPLWLDMATGFGAFFVTTIGLSLALFFALRCYDRVFKRS
jgi:hypothetical protein